MMFPSLKFGRLFGIPLFVHWTFWLLPLYVVLTPSGDMPIGLRLALLFAMFGCVVLHELGHALAARIYGIRTRDITLYPIGGIASLQRISEKPIEELVIAAAGPAVNVVIAAALFVLSILATALAPLTFPPSEAALLSTYLVFGNIFMVLFNLIPAFPLDGGRIFRALLGFFMDHLRATRVAVYAGTALTAVLLGIVMLLWREYASPFLIVIAFFVLSAGQRELMVLEYRERRRQTNPPFDAPPTMVVRDLPVWMRPAVSVYVWDPRQGVWVRQERS